jgi:hypothetical protein
VVAAGLVAGALSGAPSTLHALATGRSPMAAARAAGNVVLPARASTGALLVAGGAVHGALSLFWAAVIARLLPRRHPVAFGALAGAAIAGLDLVVVGRRRPLVAALPAVPQVADHIAFGALAAAVLSQRRRG